MSSQAMSSRNDTLGTTATSTTNTPTNLAAELKPTGGPATQKVKPCCVCTDEKSRRDECMLFSTADDPQEDCKSLVGRYRECMKGYGFTI